MIEAVLTIYLGTPAPGDMAGRATKKADGTVRLPRRSFQVTITTKDGTDEINIHLEKPTLTTTVGSQDLHIAMCSLKDLKAR
jgi:hypothetical protein